MTHAPDEQLHFGRLPDVSADLILTQMTDPRVVAHLPLLDKKWDHRDVAEFVAAKEACWRRDGLGHWAFFQGAQYVGWGGFQKEGAEWDFGLVLTSEAFGLGWSLVHKALEFAQTDPRIPYVTFLLPPSRTRLGALARLGARPIGSITYTGERFLKFRLDTP